MSSDLDKTPNNLKKNAPLFLSKMNPSSAFPGVYYRLCTLPVSRLLIES
jgi:hypothetical protein